MYEFALSFVILLGGGFLLLNGIAVEFASGLMSLVVGFWFQKRSSENAVNNLLRNPPTILPIANEFQTPPIKAETTNPTNPTNIPSRIEVDE